MDRVQLLLNKTDDLSKQPSIMSTSLTSQTPTKKLPQSKPSSQTKDKTFNNVDSNKDKRKPWYSVSK